MDEGSLKAYLYYSISQDEVSSFENLGEGKLRLSSQK